MKGRTSESDPQTCQADRILRNLVHVPRRDDKTAWVLTCPSRVWRVVRCCKAKYQPKKVLFQRERPSMRFKHLRWDRPLPRQLTQGRFKCATSLGRRNNTLSHNQNQSESLTSTYIHLHITSKSIILSQMCFSSYNRRQPCLILVYLGSVFCHVGFSVCAFHLCSESSLERASTRNCTPRRDVNFNLQIQVKSCEIPLDSLCILWGVPSHRIKIYLYVYNYIYIHVYKDNIEIDEIVTDI